MNPSQQQQPPIITRAPYNNKQLNSFSNSVAQSLNQSLNAFRSRNISEKRRDLSAARSKQTEKTGFCVSAPENPSGSNFNSSGITGFNRNNTTARKPEPPTTNNSASDIPLRIYDPDAGGSNGFSNTFYKLKALNKGNHERDLVSGFGCPSYVAAFSEDLYRYKGQNGTSLHKRKFCLCAAIFAAIITIYEIASIIVGVCYYSYDCGFVNKFMVTGASICLVILALEWCSRWICVDFPNNPSPVNRYDSAQLFFGIILTILYLTMAGWFFIGFIWVPSEYISSLTKHGKIKEWIGNADTIAQICPLAFHEYTIAYQVVHTVLALIRLIIFCYGDVCRGCCYRLNVQTRNLGNALVPDVTEMGLNNTLPPMSSILQSNGGPGNVLDSLELPGLNPLDMSTLHPTGNLHNQNVARTLAMQERAKYCITRFDTMNSTQFTGYM